MSIIVTLYVAVWGGLAVYMLRLFWLSLFFRVSHNQEAPAVTETDLPLVTVQLPMHNEKLVVARLIEAACTFDYPRERLQIQVLDDSNDDTTALIARTVEQWQQAGLNVMHVRRSNQSGHKAGNLAHAFPLASGEFIAIFDADFLPEPTWLRHTVAHFFQPGSDQLGVVQTGWTHLNATESLLTVAQTLTLEEFGLAQATRARLGLWSTFFGTAGIWRRTCIEAVGGWSADTLGEDLDLAYRAQLAGWRIGYDDTRLVSAELPTQMLAYKQQQFRWSKGGTQVTKKIVGALLRASLSPLQKIDTLLFITWPLLHAFLVCLLLLKIPQLIWVPPVAVYLDALTTFGLTALMLPVLVNGLRGKNNLPVHLGLQIGMTINNTLAMLDGLFNPQGAKFWGNTPKSGSAEQPIAYQIAPDWKLVVDLFMLLLAGIGVWLSIWRQQWLALPLLLLYLLGFGWVGGQSAWEAWQWYLSRRAGIVSDQRKS